MWLCLSWIFDCIIYYSPGAPEKAINAFLKAGSLEIAIIRLLLYLPVLFRRWAREPARHSSEIVLSSTQLWNSLKMFLTTFLTSLIFPSSCPLSLINNLGFFSSNFLWAWTSCDTSVLTYWIWLFLLIRAEGVEVNVSMILMTLSSSSIYVILIILSCEILAK